jgi:hypothetical protein
MRSVDSAAAWRVAGLADALAAHWRRLDEQFGGSDLEKYAVAVESGAPIPVNGSTVMRALFAVGDPSYALFASAGPFGFQAFGDSLVVTVVGDVVQLPEEF